MEIIHLFAENPYKIGHVNIRLKVLYEEMLFASQSSSRPISFSIPTYIMWTKLKLYMGKKYFRLHNLEIYFKLYNLKFKNVF